MVLDLYKRLKQQGLVTRLSYNLPLTQVQIGAYLGLTVAHVNRVLRSSRDEHIVILEKHCATILDLERLTRLAMLTQDGSLANGFVGSHQRPSHDPMPRLRSAYANTGSF